MKNKKIESSRICKTCEIEKPIKDFPYRKQPNGYYYARSCRICRYEKQKSYACPSKSLVYRKKYNKNRYAENKDKLQKNARDYYYVHKKQMYTYSKEYRKKNKEKMRNWCNQYYKKNREKLRPYLKISAQKGRDKLVNSYLVTRIVAQMKILGLVLSRHEVPEELIKIKYKQLKLHRHVKNNNKSKILTGRKSS